MKGATAAGIAILLLAAIAGAGAYFFAWPMKPEPTAPTSSARAPAPPAADPAPPAATPAPLNEAAKTLKNLADQVGPRTDSGDRPPSFDVARIEPDGEAVIAGQAAPGATVDLLRGGVRHAQTVAGPSGDFVMIPDRLPAGTYELTLRATHRDGKISTSKKSIAVELRSGGPDKPAVAQTAPRTTPDKPAVALAAPGKPDTPRKPDAAPPKPDTAGAATIDLAIDAVKGEAGEMHVSGRAAAGMKVNLYLNDAYIASATAPTDGRIAFSIQSGIRPGDYRVRLDQVDGAGRVRKRVEAPFKAPAMLAAAPAPATTQPPTPDNAPTTTAPAPAGSGRVATPPAPAGEKTTAGAKETAEATKQPAPTQARPRIASAPPAADANPAAQQPAPEPKTAPAPRNEADAPARQPPPPAPAASEAAASQRPAARQAESQRPASQKPASQQPAPQQPAQQQPAPQETASQQMVSQPPAPENTTPPPPAPAPSAEKNGYKNAMPASVVIIPHVETAVVVRGDSLWRISEHTYGHGIRYPTIYNANRDKIRDPDLIYPGQIFVLPKEGP